MRVRFRFGQFKKRNPEKFNTLISLIIADLPELEKWTLQLNFHLKLLKLVNQQAWEWWTLLF
jgi:hypothetical protein